jgi:hypothetical protein
VTFKAAVGKTPHLENAWKAGLGALRAQDRPHVVPADGRELRGSVDVDTALQKQDPNANRWDFGIAYQHTNRPREFVYWVEIHTANDKEIKVVRKKLDWLKKWLAGDGKLLAQFERNFVWVSSGATSFTSDSPQVKQLAQLGLQHEGTVLRIPSAHTA